MDCGNISVLIMIIVMGEIVARFCAHNLSKRC